MNAVSAQAYLDRALEIVHRATETQLSAVRQAADVVCSALAAGGRFVVFGTGHSHALAEELYGRAGGLHDVVAVLEPSLMLHEGLEKSSRLERLTGLGAELADLHGVCAGDAVVVASNSGRNAVPVEFALACRERGARVIALTSLACVAI